MLREVSTLNRYRPGMAIVWPVQDTSAAIWGVWLSTRRHRGEEPGAEADSRPTRRAVNPTPRYEAVEYTVWIWLVKSDTRLRLLLKVVHAIKKGRQTIMNTIICVRLFPNLCQIHNSISIPFEIDEVYLHLPYFFFGDVNPWTRLILSSFFYLLANNVPQCWAKASAYYFQTCLVPLLAIFAPQTWQWCPPSGIQWVTIFAHLSGYIRRIWPTQKLYTKMNIKLDLLFWDTN